MNRINLKGLSEVLSAKELKNVMGGSYGFCLTDSMCDSDEFCNLWYLRCETKPTNTPKIDACEGKQENDPCSWKSEMGITYWGRCLAFAMNYTLHCSDLN